MVTYQDLLAVGQNEQERMDFIRTAITKYQASEFYQTAKAADQYDRKRNPDIQKVMKTLYTVTGKRVPDVYGSNYKIGRALFPFFIMQENQYLLANGVTWEKTDTPERLGTKRAPFDSQLQEAAHAALWGGTAYGFWNLDHVDVFNALEYFPLPDEENGAHRAGIRFWQIDETKPFRATLYEEDGFTDYIWGKRDGLNNVHSEGVVLREKRSYVIKVTGTQVDEERIYEGENYPSFPIVPLWANKKHQSELTGLREGIYVYDIIKSGFANSVEEAAYIFWSVSGAPGMDDEDLAKLLQRIKEQHIAVTEDGGSTATPSQIEAPYASRETLLARLERDLFKDAMAFDPEHITSGAATATQIRAAYEALDAKVNDFEYCVLDFVNNIMDLAGVEDNPTFTRSRNVNVAEEVQTVMQAATALDDEYVTRKILTILGDGDQADEIIERKNADETTRARELAAALEGVTEVGDEDGSGAPGDGEDNLPD